MVNQGQEGHHIQLVRLAAGKTMDDFQRAMQAAGQPPPWVIMVGGPGAADPGGEANATTYMPAGQYVLLCFVPAPDGKPHIAHGMFRDIMVE